MKIYHMEIERIYVKDGEPNVRKTYKSPHQGAAPAGWRCVAVSGYYETPENPNKRTKNNED